MDPHARVAWVSVSGNQLGSVAVALFVRQTPPLAVAAYRMSALAGCGARPVTRPLHDRLPFAVPSINGAGPNWVHWNRLSGMLVDGSERPSSRSRVRRVGRRRMRIMIGPFSSTKTMALQGTDGRAASRWC